MTTTTGTTEHPDVSEISDLTEGLLSPTRSVEVRAHLDGCSLCADVYESLEEIRGLLGSLPGPPRMPADVAARVDAALAAEALLNATAPDPLAADAAADVSRETSRTTQTADTDTDAPEASEAEREPSAVPVAVTPGATAAGATAPDAPRADRPAGRSRGATGPGRARQVRRRRGAIFGAVFGTAAIGVSVLLFQTIRTSSTGDDATSFKSDAGTRQLDDAQAFSGTGIRERVDSLLASTPANGEPRAAENEDSTRNAPSAEASPKLVPQLPPCIQQGTGRPDTPLAAERGTYEGTDAFLVVLSDPTDGSLVRVYVIDAACVDVVPPTKGELLLTQTYPRR